MYLQNKANQDLVEILDVQALIDPSQAAVSGRFHSGEEMQDASNFNKADLQFPSGEALPRCWTDANYQA